MHVNVAQEKLRRPGLNDILYLIFKFAVTLRKSFAALTPWLDHWQQTESWRKPQGRL
jgi:hypothetical protein